MTLSTIETQIKNDWNWVRANIALHPYLSVLAALVAGGVLSRIL